jgi:hypothetical protein
MGTQAPAPAPPAPAATQGAATAGPTSGTPGGGDLTETAAHHDAAGTAVQGPGAAGVVHSEGTSEVRIATDASEAESGIDDMELWTDAEDGDAAQVDLEMREGETEKDRRARIGAFFKAKVRARLGRSGKGVRKPHKSG